MDENDVPTCENERPVHGSPLAEWDGVRYAANTGHHRRFDEWFLATFPVRPTDRLLDVGCGSGDFTAKVAALVPDGWVVGIDASPSMIREARSVALPNQSLAVATAQRLSSAVAGDEPFDGAYSRATLQWIDRADHLGILRAVRDALVPGGWLRLEMGGAGNIAAIVALTAEVSRAHGGPPPPWSFLDAGEGLELVERSGLTLEPPAGSTSPAGYVRTVPQRRPFTEDELRGWFESQCLQAFDALEPGARAAFRTEVLDRIGELRRHDGSFDQTFVRLDLLAYRPPAPGRPA